MVKRKIMLWVIFILVGGAVLGGTASVVEMLVTAGDTWALCPILAVFWFVFSLVINEFTDELN